VLINMPLVNTRRVSALQRREKPNSLHGRLKDRVGGWSSTPSGLRAGTVQVVSSGGGERIRVASKVMLSGTTTDEILNDSETAIDVADGTKFSVGDTIRIDAEHMKVSRVETNTLYVVRGSDGTANVAHANGLPIYKVNAKTPTRYSELDSETLKFVKDGSSFNYPKQMQFIPASALNFGSAFDFTDNNLVDYDDDQYDVLFILKDMQTYSVEGSDENSNQFLQVSAESKTATGFTPTANVGVRVLTTSNVTSFADATFGYGGTPLSDPTYATDYDDDPNEDAYHDDNTDNVLSLTVTYTLNFAAVKGSGEFIVEGFVRAGTEDTSNTDRFISSGYSQSSFTEIRDAGIGDGTVTRTANFSFGSGLGTDPCKVVITVTNYSQMGGSTATLTGTITQISYVTASGATRSVTGRNRADAIVIAR